MKNPLIKDMIKIKEKDSDEMLIKFKDFIDVLLKDVKNLMDQKVA